jgi:hypothetical protein
MLEEEEFEILVVVKWLMLAMTRRLKSVVVRMVEE